MSKLIVTHVSPDLDGIPAIWLLRKFHPDFKNARIAFVPAGSTYNNEPPDSNVDIVHVDTGMGKFDHHQTSEFTCGAQRVYEYLVSEGYVKDDEALGRMVKILTEIDHGWDNYKWPDPDNDRNEFFVHNVLSGIKILYPNQDEKYVEWVTFQIEAIYKLLQAKVRAEQEMKDGKKFKTRWGEGLAVYTSNSTILELGIKKGIAVVVIKDPKRGNIRVTGLNSKKVDFTKAYEMILKRDKVGNWFLHASKVLLRNGSIRNPTMKASPLSLDDMIDILEKA
ncbi:MAG TPA: hypothetical protein VLE91_01725 [Candidatus Saccharimonadales bacterium]|nr:hypothetical protein [Candidatus Saccharimonadales bacterium]